MWFRRLRSKIIYDYAVIPFWLTLFGQIFAYYVTRVINSLLRGPVENYFDISTKLDNAIPLIPWWVSVYFLCYIFWVVGYIAVARQSKEICFKMLMADFISKILCSIIFIVFPTTLARPQLTDNSFFSSVVQLLYSIDRPDNLFPSMHCSVSWLTARYILKCNSIGRLNKFLSVVAAILVFFSVLFTKQHVIIDIFAGIAIVEISIVLSEKTGLYKLYDKLDCGKLIYERKKTVGRH